MVEKEVLNVEFKKVGLHVQSEVLDICAEVCERQKIDERSLVDSWVAFSMSVLNSSVPPSADKLIFFEKREFGDPIFSTPKQSKIGEKITKNEIHFTSPVPSTTPKRRIEQVYETEQSVNCPISQVFSQNNGNGQSTSRPSAPRSFLPRITSPRSDSPPIDLDPIPLSSSVDFFTPGETVMTYGYTTDFSPCNFVPNSILNNGEVKKSWSTMMDLLYDTWDICRGFAEEIATSILKANNLPEPAPLDNLPIESSVYVGKIIQELGRIEVTDLLIEGLGRYSKDQVVLDIAGIQNYSVFPGQVIAFRGVSRGASRIIATHLYTAARPPVPKPPVIPEPFSIMIAGGPFSPMGYVDKSIVNSLINHAKTIQPAFLILVGPFMDSNSPFVRDPQSILYSDKRFKKTHGEMMRQFCEAFSDLKLKTKVYYLSSSRDVNSLPMYPTPICNMKGEISHEILPDPSLLNINGLMFGITSSDIIFFLSHQEFSNCKSGNRVTRLAQHLINQQSFYPLETGAFDDTPLDYPRLFNYCRIPVIPHVLVLPSDLGHFIKEVDGCIIINPEKCVKGRRGNNFALIEVRNQKGSEEWTPATHISAKIVRI